MDSKVQLFIRFTEPPSHLPARRSGGLNSSSPPLNGLCVCVCERVCYLLPQLAVSVAVAKASSYPVHVSDSVSHDSLPTCLPTKQNSCCCSVYFHFLRPDFFAFIAASQNVSHILPLPLSGNTVFRRFLTILIFYFLLGDRR